MIKIFHGSQFKFSILERFSPNVVTEFSNGSVVKFEKKVRVHSGTKIKVRSGAKLFLGAEVSVNYNCILICHDNIHIGKGTEIGSFVQIYDHDHKFKNGLKKDEFKTSPIIIGKNCWIGANTVILRGTKIGDNCVVGAGSIIKGEFGSNLLIVQKRRTDVVPIE